MYNQLSLDLLSANDCCTSENNFEMALRQAWEEVNSNFWYVHRYLLVIVLFLFSIERENFDILNPSVQLLIALSFGVKKHSHESQCDIQQFPLMNDHENDSDDDNSKSTHMLCLRFIAVRVI